MIMKRLFLFLLPAVMLGMFASCDDTEKIDNNQDGNDPGQSVSIKANQVKIGSKVISFDIKDTLTVQEGVMRIFGGPFEDNPVAVATGSHGSLGANILSEYLSKDIDLSLVNLSDSIYDNLAFDFSMNSGSDSMFIVLDWDYNGKENVRLLGGAINTDSIKTLFKSGTLRMDLDTPKKLFTFKISAELFDGTDFELYISMPYCVQYIFNFYTYSHETWDPYDGYRSLTDFSAFDPISEYLETFTLQAADTTAQAKLAVFKEAVGKLETIISLVNDSVAKDGFYSENDCFIVKLITWGYGGNNRVLGYKKWFKRYVEAWIPTDATLREKLYSTIDEDYWEYIED